MKKNLVLTALLLSPLLTTTFTYAESSPNSCEQMFQQAETLITEAEKQPGTHKQVGKIKEQFEKSKQLILTLDTKVQLESCEIALQKITRLLK